MDNTTKEHTMNVTVERRVDERIKLDRVHMQEQVKDQSKARAAAKRDYAKRVTAVGKLADTILASTSVTPEADAKVNEAHREMLAALERAVAATNAIASLEQRIAALDDPAERKARIARAEKAVKARQTEDAMSGKEAAVVVLRANGGAMHYREITSVALDSGLIATKGKTPEATMNATLSKALREDDTPFVRVAAGVFGLKPEVAAKPAKKAKAAEAVA